MPTKHILLGAVLIIGLAFVITSFVPKTTENNIPIGIDEAGARVLSSPSDLHKVTLLVVGAEERTQQGKLTQALLPNVEGSRQIKLYVTMLASDDIKNGRLEFFLPPESGLKILEPLPQDISGMKRGSSSSWEYTLELPVAKDIRYEIAAAVIHEFVGARSVSQANVALVIGTPKPMPDTYGDNSNIRTIITQ